MQQNQRVTLVFNKNLIVAHFFTKNKKKISFEFLVVALVVTLVVALIVALVVALVVTLVVAKMLIKTDAKSPNESQMSKRRFTY